MLTKMFSDLAYLTNYNPVEYSEVTVKDNVLVAKVLMPNSVKEDIKVTLTDKIVNVYKVNNKNNEYKLAYYLNIEKYKIDKSRCNSKYEGEMLYINLPLVVEKEYEIKLD